jgi:hypothetical protein
MDVEIQEMVKISRIRKADIHQLQYFFQGEGDEEIAYKGSGEG